MAAEEIDFLDAIRAAPDDNDLLAVYADWLSERDDPRADYVRLMLRLAKTTLESGLAFSLRWRLRKLGDSLDPNWKMLVHRSKIDNCQFVFDYECPKRWENLDRTEKENERFCTACGKSVYFCDSARDVRDRARAGECVAVSASLQSRAETHPPQKARLGRVVPDGDNPVSEDFAEKFHQILSLTVENRPKYRHRRKTDRRKRKKRK